MKHKERGIDRIKRFPLKGRSDGGGGQVVSIRGFYSEDPSSKSAVFMLYALLHETTKNITKESGIGPFKNSLLVNVICVLKKSHSQPV